MRVSEQVHVRSCGAGCRASLDRWANGATWQAPVLLLSPGEGSQARLPSGALPSLALPTSCLQLEGMLAGDCICTNAAQG